MVATRSYRDHIAQVAHRLGHVARFGGAIAELPARQREAVGLRYYLAMTEDQAAQAMRVSRGTVKSATSRGLAALGRLLKEEQ